jgi:hypothetical protein
MIRFRCNCQELLEVPADQAGESIQCPNCGRLVDVPYLEQLQSMEDDGTIRLADDPKPKPLDIRAAARSFTRDTRDETGREIDLRPNLRDFLASNTAGIERVDEDAIAPAYDPFTGELIRPLDVTGAGPGAPDAASPASIPMAKPALQYARKAPVGPAVQTYGLWSVFARMCSPINLFIVVLIGFVHAVNVFVGILPLSGLLYLFLFAIPLCMIMIGHYGNIIDEIGREDRDELPAPLRSGSFIEDAWRPFVQISLATILAALPIILLRISVSQFDLDLPPAADWAAAAAFYLAFPALALTTVCSGSLNNILPGRALGTIPAIGAGYLLICASLAVGAETVLIGTAMLAQTGSRANQYLLGSGTINYLPAIFPFMSRTMESILAVPVILIGSYFVHASAWMLGISYRKHHAAFPWVLQRHVSTRNDTARQLEQMRHTRPPTGPTLEPTRQVSH